MVRFCDFSKVEDAGQMRQMVLDLLTDTGFRRQVADSRNDMYVRDGIEGCIAVTSSLVAMFCPSGNASFRLMDIDNVIIDGSLLEVTLKNKACVVVKLTNASRVQGG